MLRKLLLILCIGTIWFGNPIYGSASDSHDRYATYASGDRPVDRNKLEEFDRLADSVYRYTSDGNILEVRKRIAQMEKLFAQIRFEGAASVEGVGALSECIVDMKRIVNQATIQPERWLEAAATVRLAADALTHPEQPMWHQYYKVMNDDIERMEQGLAAETGGAAAIRAAFAAFQQHYNVIRPAAAIQRASEEIEKLDSMMAYLRQRITKDKVEREDLRKILPVGRQWVNELFFGKKDVPTFMPIVGTNDQWIWTLWIGTVVVIVLGYVAWRKYRYEKKAEAERRRRKPER
ncbi:sporulation protein YpjB [Paenibacillus sp. MSJ-34]|uniref:sporulation protein YpjB n=1 Tax=Paenibacillus sp. MSJ-34 TaxID=2841529 RepID=UPI001C122D0B|nr:sporulation protein YpjB [Paenibacillus sp. MSJ-34]MBU5443994.1 sporulation protein YpjB [Paenibacillus sp. MSJ-34]